MVEVKGTVVRDSIKAVKARHGEQAYADIVGLLKGETRSLFEKGSVMSIGWYPLDAFVEFLEMDLKVTAQGNEQELIRRSEVIIEQELKGIYRVFVKLGSPRFVLNRISTVHQTYFRGVEIEVSLPASGNAILKYTGFERRHRLIGLSIIGFYRKALEISGAKNVKAEFATKIEDDKGYCELLVTWSDK
jgi:hypothetical protein